MARLVLARDAAATFRDALGARDEGRVLAALSAPLAGFSAFSVASLFALKAPSLRHFDGVPGR